MTLWDRLTAWLSVEALFLLAVVGGALVKVGFSGPLTWRQRAFTVFAAVWFAVIFTDVALYWSGLDASHKVPVAAILALTGESIARLIVGIVSDREVLLDALRAWRGR